MSHISGHAPHTRPTACRKLGSWFSPFLPKLAMQEQAAAFPHCQAAHLWGVLRLGQGCGEGEDGARFPELCPHPALC